MGSSCSIDPSIHSNQSKKIPSQSKKYLPKANKNVNSIKSLTNIDSKTNKILKKSAITFFSQQNVSSFSNNKSRKSSIYINSSVKSTAEISNASMNTLNPIFFQKPSENIFWKSWKNLIPSNSNLLQTFYTSYISEPLPLYSEYEIKKDLPRTFPMEKFFQILNNETFCEGQDKLFKVLKAITLHFPNIGYCQGVNFLVGFCLLMNGGNESDTFCFFVKLSMDSNFFLIHLYEEKFPLLYFLIFVFNRVAKQKIPEIFEFLKKLDFPEEAWLTKWYLSFFLNGFPLDQAVRFWDFFLSNNLFSLISLTISLMKNLKYLFYNKEKIDFMNLINDLNKNKFLNVEKCIKEAKKIRINKRKIGKLAEEFIQINPKYKKNFCLLYFLSYNRIKIKISKTETKKLK